MQGWLHRSLTASGLQQDNSSLLNGLALVCLALPFLVFYWLVPVFSSLTIGNDYPAWSIDHQQALMYSLEHGTFPLYVPGFAMGQSATALTLGQLFHPLPHLARLFPGYWEGDALCINTQLRLISLGCVQLLLFYALKKLGLRTLLAFVLSFITIYNLRMLDMFRYGASLENFTAFVILCSCIILCALEFRRWYFVGIVIGSFLLTVGGHPQIAYIGFLGAFILTLLAPGFVASVRPGVAYGSKRLLTYWCLVLLATLTGGLLAAPYITGFYFDFLPYNELRTNNTYTWSTAYQDSWGGLFRSFYSPLSSDVHGAFGGSAIVILALLFPVAVVIYRKYLSIAWLTFMAAVFVFLLACGDATPIHRMVWEYLPMSSNFRVPGRYTLMILFPLLLVLVWICSIGIQEANGGRKPVVPFLASNGTILAFIGCVLFIVLNQSIDQMLPDSSWFSPEHINDVTRKDFNRGFYLGLAALVTLAVYFELSARRLRILSASAGFVLVALVVLEATNALRYGTWVTAAKNQPTADKIAAYMQDSYSVPAAPGSGMSMALIDRQIERSILEPKLARFYRIVSAFEDEQALQRYLLTERKPNEAAILGSRFRSLPRQSGIEDRIDEVQSTAFRYNQLEFSVASWADGLLSTNLPFRQNWHVFVDGVTAEAVMANGYETAVFVPAGTHEVVFRYESNAIAAGMLVACISLTMTLLYAAWKVSGRTIRGFCIVSSAFPLALYAIWAGSLYNGDRLDVGYSWNGAEFPSNENLAYAKQASASSILNDTMRYYFYPGLAIDGDVDGRPFSSALSEQPSWKVDLGALRSIRSIVIHKPMAGSLPISIRVSNDGELFTDVAEIRTADKEVIVRLEPSIEARFVAMQSEGRTRLGFSEVEILGK